MSSPTPIDHYQRETLTFPMRNGVSATHDVFTRGTGKKVVIIIQELPGIGQETLALADHFVASGYIVVLPHLFGPIGRTSMVGNFVRVFCLRKEFYNFARQQSSPIVDFLSQLCSLMKDRYRVKGVAVIGMCLTGNFAISLMANDDVLAAFASQPSLPLLAQKHLHMSPKEIEQAKHNLDRVGPMHAARFAKDPLCSAAKFAAINATFNDDGQTRIILDELPGRGHSILTLDFCDAEGHPTQAKLEEVMQYFDDRLA